MGYKVHPILAFVEDEFALTMNKIGAEYRMMGFSIYAEDRYLEAYRNDRFKTDPTFEEFKKSRR